MRLDELQSEVTESGEPSDEEFVDDDEQDLAEDLTDALDLLQRGLALLSQVIIKPSTGRVRFAPEELPEYVEELQEFLGQWDDYGIQAVESDL